MAYLDGQSGVDNKAKTFVREQIAREFIQSYQRLNYALPEAERVERYVNNYCAILTREGYTEVEAPAPEAPAPALEALEFRVRYSAEDAEWVATVHNHAPYQALSHLAVLPSAALDGLLALVADLAADPV